jgi:hypothetical protein
MNASAISVAFFLALMACAAGKPDVSLAASGENFDADDFRKYGAGDIRCEGEQLLGVRVGQWSYFYPSGTLFARGSYENGAKSGLWQYWYQSGSLWMAGEWMKVAEAPSRPHGLWVEFSEDGKIDTEDRPSVICVDGAVGLRPRWAGRVDWSGISEGGFLLAKELLPGPANRWKGTGYYIRGSRRASLEHKSGELR